MKKVSFIIIAYNEAKNIGRCINSILCQEELENFELIVVDDGSKDGTSEIVKGFQEINENVKLIQLVPNRGRGAARAAGINSAIGDYIAFIDADIILPSEWLRVCLGYMKEYDAVGGIAVPDGDVNYLYVRFGLIPKIVHHSTVITGNNGLYKQKIFDKHNFDSNLRDGEDIAFNHFMDASGYKTRSISSLIVEHRESKTYHVSLRWLYQSGVGASRQFKDYGKIRIPDLVFFGFLLTLLASSTYSVFSESYQFLFLAPLYVLVAGSAHVYTRFHFEYLKVVNYFSAVVTDSSFLLSYFCGRIAGLAISDPKKKPIQSYKSVAICFDFEGKWGMPSNSEYDIKKATNRLLDILDRYHVKATFFVVGKIIEEQPELIAEIAAHGHEIAIHGYMHERLNKLNSTELIIFGDNLSRVGGLLKKITGKEPTGFRAPFLMSPAFHSRDLYSLLKKNNYIWAINRSIRHEREFLRPGNHSLAKYFFTNRIIRIPLFLLLNWRFVFTDTINSSSRFPVFSNIRWLLSGMPAFERNGLTEFPAHAPFDWELVGLPCIEVETSQELLDFAVDTLVGNVQDAKGDFNLSFHDWIIGTSNRTQILERVLETLSKIPGVRFVLPTEMM